MRQSLASLVLQAPYLVYVEVLECSDVYTAPVPNRLLENTLRHVRSEEDLAIYEKAGGDGGNSSGGTGGSSPRPEFSVYGNNGGDYDDADCWSQEDDEIIQVWLPLLKADQALGDVSYRRILVFAAIPRSPY